MAEAGLSQRSRLLKRKRSRHALRLKVRPIRDRSNAEEHSLSQKFPEATAKVKYQRPKARGKVPRQHADDEASEKTSNEIARIRGYRRPYRAGRSAHPHLWECHDRALDQLQARGRDSRVRSAQPLSWSRITSKAVTPYDEGQQDLIESDGKRSSQDRGDRPDLHLAVKLDISNIVARRIRATRIPGEGKPRGLVH